MKQNETNNCLWDQIIGSNGIENVLFQAHYYFAYKQNYRLKDNKLSESGTK
jgi:hypothetical protein